MLLRVINTMLFSLLLFVSASLAQSATYPIPLADPTIFHHKGTYYLYGTGGQSDNGFFVYTSTDLKNWQGPLGASDGYALKKGDAYGTQGFWAPQVFEKDGRFFMAYTADEHIALAVSPSPLGPFVKYGAQPLSGPVKQIDPFVFYDESEGQWYMYHVRLTSGNRIYVARLQPDLTDVDTTTAKELIHGEPGWENTWNAEWPVTEGPTVFKKGDRYYMMYSANDFRNPDYAVGYASAPHPNGPWVKHASSPVISRLQTRQKGTGHGDLLNMPDGSMKYVLHTHHDSSRVGPRLTGIIDVDMQEDADGLKISSKAESFKYLSTNKKHFTNPLLRSGADPFSFFKDGYYYYTNTRGNKISIWKTKELTDLRSAKEYVAFDPPPGTTYSKHLWAPEIHFLQGKWYIYFAASAGDITKQRMYVLENSAADPTQGEWVMKGQVKDATDKWAIDGNVFEYKGRMYMIWSGWEGDNNVQQNIYIAAMRNPWSIEGERVCIAKPTYKWELHGTLKNEGNKLVLVNEGPQYLMHSGKLFIVYSASGCWTDNYALGLLTFKGGDLLKASNWVKNPTPVFSGSVENSVYAPGHNSFFKSPDGRQDWILYHANDKPGQGCGGFRSPRAQPFTWKADGTPDFGVPKRTGLPLEAPSAMN